MENLNLLFERNGSGNKFKLLPGGKAVIEYSPADGIFSGVDIKRLIQSVNGLHKRFGDLKISIIIKLGNIQIIDKLAYVFLECICYYLISTWKHPVQVYFKPELSIWVNGITSSPLLLLNDTSRKSIKKFLEKFKFDIYKNHYRRLISKEDQKKDNYLGRLLSELYNFLKVFNVEADCLNDVAEVIVELIGNAGEHADTDCLVDIDVAPGYQRIDDENSMYYGINIAVINFCEKLLGEDIFDNILSDSTVKNGRYNEVVEAYRAHSAYFDSGYVKEDFCNVTAFQNKISGRRTLLETGGTGLSTLIRSLEEMSETYRCYVISGNRSINFLKKYLRYDVNGWIGFNDSSYLNDIPAKEILGECLIYMPGTAYNLNFVMKGK